jgi:uncharacterized membrane protein required for colicin V production
MIPVEYFWGILFIVFGIIGMARGLLKELGATTILLLSLFALKLGWDQVGAKIVEAVQERAPDDTIMAAYFGIAILFVAFISYEGVVLQFPMKRLTGPAKALFGLMGGLLNGYLIIGTIWDVMAQANYFRPTTTVLSGELSDLHNSIVQYLPVTFMNEFVLLALGMILLLAIVLR